MKTQHWQAHLVFSVPASLRLSSGWLRFVIFLSVFHPWLLSFRFCWWVRFANWLRLAIRRWSARSNGRLERDGRQEWVRLVISQSPHPDPTAVEIRMAWLEGDFFDAALVVISTRRRELSAWHVAPRALAGGVGLKGLSQFIQDLFDGHRGAQQFNEPILKCMHTHRSVHLRGLLPVRCLCFHLGLRGPDEHALHVA